jgi:hypothetical protein
MNMNKKILQWYATGETGVSSKAMAAAVSGCELDPGWSDHPSDPADFNRCLKFLIAVPEANLHMSKVAALSDIWAKLVDRWDELEQCFIDEVGFDWEKGRELHASKTYQMMKEIQGRA